MRKLLILVLCAGCMVPGMNEVGLQSVVNDLKVAKEKNEKTATKLKAIVEEINNAQQQEREPVIAPLISEAATSVSETAESVDEAGKTATTLQAGIGTPKPSAVIPSTPDQKEQWRLRYLALAKLLDQLKSWAGSKMPFISSPQQSQPQPWSASDIAALITAITAGAGVLGLGGKKTLDAVNKSKAISLEAEKLAEIFKTKCNGDNEFANVMRDLPTITRDHRERKVEEL